MSKDSLPGSDWFTAMGTFDVLAPLLPAIRQEFISRSTFRMYPAGHVIYVQDDRGQEFHRIVSGLVRMSYLHWDGRQLVYSFFERNDCFGYSNLVDGKGLPHTTEAHTDVEVQVVARDDFKALRAHREFEDALLRLVCGHMRLACDYIADALLDSCAARIATRLLECARPNASGRRHLELPQEEIGLMVGATRQSVNQVLREFQQNGIVHLSYGKVIVDDFGALERRAKGGKLLSAT
ncbi:CRP/FNR family cyclic AMP-dependent transcriptional regulator [Bradyrhizobium sp. GM5.1]